MLVFKDPGGLSPNMQSFSVVRKYLKARAFLEKDEAGVVYVGFVPFRFI